MPSPSISSNSDGLVLMSGIGMEAAGGIIRDANGQPHKFYRKDLARVGEFVNASRGQSISITPELLSHWADETNRYIKAGNKVPVPAGHDLTANPDRNRGFLHEAFIEGDILYGRIELIGEDAIASASRNHVSIYSPPDFTDGEGRKWNRPIRHVALTPDPVITKQGDFLPIAASHGTINVDIIKRKEQTVDFKKLKTNLGIDSDITDDNAVDVLCSHFAKVKDSADTTKLTERITALESELAEAKKQPAGAHELSHTERGLAKRLIDNELAARVKDGNITPAVAEKLKATLTGGDHMLGFGQSGDPLALKVLDALKGNDPVKLGEQTGRQVIEMGRGGSGDDDSSKDYVEKEAADARKRAEQRHKR